MMNQKKPKKPKFKTRAQGERYNLTDLSLGYLDYLFNDEIRVLVGKKEHYSVIQYVNTETVKSFIETATDTYNAIARMPRNLTFLNMGMGAGFLERTVLLYGKVNLESVEWEEQDILFYPLREHLGVKADYLCNSIFNENFEIYECNQRYDYIIATRFVPLNHSNANLKEVKEILNRFKKYSDKLIIIDYYSNYATNVRKFFNSIQLPQLPTKKLFDHWVLDLSKV